MTGPATWEQLYYFWITVGALVVGTVYATVRVMLFLQKRNSCDKEK